MASSQGYSRGWMKRMVTDINSGLSAEAAVDKEQSSARARLGQATDPYMRDRLHDLDDLSNRLLRILTGDNEAKLEKEAFYFKNFIEKKIEARVLGPVSAPIFRLKRKFRIRMLIRGSKSLKLQNSIAEIIPKYKFSSGIKLSVDVDPISFN